MGLLGVLLVLLLLLLAWDGKLNGLKCPEELEVLRGKMGVVEQLICWGSTLEFGFTLLNVDL